METSAFEEYIDTFSDNAVQALCTTFEADIPDITQCVSKGMQCCAVSIGVKDDKAEVLAKLKVEL